MIKSPSPYVIPMLTLLVSAIVVVEAKSFKGLRGFMDGSP